MFYAYKVIDGVLHVKTTPSGPWRAMSAAEITAHLSEAEADHKRQVADFRAALSPFGRYAYAVRGRRDDFRELGWMGTNDKGEGAQVNITAGDFRRAAELMD